MLGRFVGVVVVLGFVCGATPWAHAADETGFVDLFNGHDLTGWVVEGKSTYSADGEEKPIWTVADGQIECHGNGYGFLRYDRSLGDAVIHVEYRNLRVKE